MGVSVYLIEQWRHEVDDFATKSDFCLICLILTYILLLFTMINADKNGVLFMLNSENKAYDSKISAYHAF